MLLRKFIIVIFLISLNATAEEIRLSCSMLIKRTLPNGSTESKKEMVFADIDTDDSGFYIELKGDDLLLSITSRGFTNKEIVKNVLNNSNSNKWDISNFSKLNELNIEGEDYLYLDRNTGKINIRSEHTRNNKKILTTNGSGVCEKINTKFKKF
jgi:hypothetical protein